MLAAMRAEMPEAKGLTAAMQAAKPIYQGAYKAKYEKDGKVARIPMAEMREFIRAHHKK